MLSIEERSKILTILQMTSASISMIASATLITMILRSHKKLSTTLHRLLFGLSICDFVASFAISFGSTLSPTDHFGWNASGNMTLCRVQGFVFFWSHNASPVYNCSLCLYYLIEIKYTTLQEYLSKIEIAFHVMPVLLPLTVAIIIQIIDDFHPSWASCSYRVIAPLDCRYDPEVECDEGLQNHRPISLAWIIYSKVIVPLTIFISMLVIYREVSIQEHRTDQYRFSYLSTASTRRPRGSYLASRNTIAARDRALAYSTAWLLSWITFFVIVVMRFVLGKNNVLPFQMQVVHFILFPLQGLFNFIVYIFPKVRKRLVHFKRQGIAQPKRFVLAFCDSIKSRGQVVGRGSTTPTHSRLLNRRRPLTQPSIQTSSVQDSGTSPRGKENDHNVNNTLPMAEYMIILEGSSSDGEKKEEIVNIANDHV